MNVVNGDEGVNNEVTFNNNGKANTSRRRGPQRQVPNHMFQV
jgi:hypothetical protein